MCSGESEKLTYSTFGAACTEVEINLLTGERRVLRSDVLHDAEGRCMLSLGSYDNKLASV